MRGFVCVCISCVLSMPSSCYWCPYSYVPYTHTTITHSNRRDREICRLAQQAGVSVFSAPSHTLHDMDAYLNRWMGGSPPISYQVCVGGGRVHVWVWVCGGNGSYACPNAYVDVTHLHEWHGRLT